jgi:MoaA/NifB/PqqE/SkfB family radical SAM enzyme
MDSAARLSVGIGLTNDCNLACAHCYRDVERVDYVSLDQIKTICALLPVGSMGFGTGENALHPEFVAIVEYLHGQGVRLSLASNGYSLMAVSSDTLRMFHDVEVSIDFAAKEEQDAFRGSGNWDLVHQAMERCRTLGVHLSILATMMRNNYAQMDRLAALAQAQGVTLRVNAYQAVKTDRFKLTYEQFWEGYRRLFGAARVVACAEPVVRAAMGLDDVRSPCGHTSIRFNPRGQIIPCVYWPVSGAAPTIADLSRLGLAAMETADFQRARQPASVAANCRCRGGCATRRALNGNLDAHDDYCPWVRGEDMALDWQPAPALDLVRTRNVCTTVVM